MFIVTDSVTVTTDAAGAADVDSVKFTGRLLSIQYVKDDFTDGVDFTITTATTGRGVWTQITQNASIVKAPRQACHSIVGVALNYNDEGDEPVVDYIDLADEGINIVVAQGGSGKVGTFRINVEGVK